MAASWGNLTIVMTLKPSMTIAQNRNQFIEFLKEKGIHTSVHFIPIHYHPFYQKKYRYQLSDFPIANDVFNKSVSLPIYPGLSTDEIKYICTTIKQFII